MLYIQQQQQEKTLYNKIQIVNSSQIREKVFLILLKIESYVNSLKSLVVHFKERQHRLSNFSIKCNGKLRNETAFNSCDERFNGLCKTDYDSFIRKVFKWRYMQCGVELCNGLVYTQTYTCA